MSNPVGTWPLPTTQALLWEHPSISAPTILYTNTDSQLGAIVTAMDVCNTAGSSGNGFQIIIDTSNTVVFQAQRGSGSFDDFPYRGNLVIPPGRTLTLEPAGGQWDCVGFGIIQVLLVP